MADEIEIYTDGGCHGNPGPGGWAFIISGTPDGAEEWGYERETTNNRMELTAVIKALEYADKHTLCSEEKLKIFTDSQYVQKGISQWISVWLKNNWKTAAKKPVKNQDLWIQLKTLSDKCLLQWHWVRGHTGNEKNERCDFLVQKAIKDQI